MSSSLISDLEGIRRLYQIRRPVFVVHSSRSKSEREKILNNWLKLLLKCRWRGASSEKVWFFITSIFSQRSSPFNFLNRCLDKSERE